MFNTLTDYLLFPATYKPINQTMLLLVCNTLKMFSSAFSNITKGIIIYNGLSLIVEYERKSAFINYQFGKLSFKHFSGNFHLGMVSLVALILTI